MIKERKKEKKENHLFCLNKPRKITRQHLKETENHNYLHYNEQFEKNISTYMIPFLALPRTIFLSCVSRDGIRKSEGTIGTEPTQGYSQIDLRNCQTK